MGQTRGLRGWNVAVLFAIGLVWCASTTQREKRVVGDLHEGRVASLEDQAAAQPDDPARVRELAQAYLDARQPGMALATIEHTKASVREEPSVEHLYARALLDQGRSADALAAEQRVLARCAEPLPGMHPCSSYLVASATRREGILAQLVHLGVEDANVNTEAASLAYLNATRQVSLSVR